MHSQEATYVKLYQVTWSHKGRQGRGPK